MPDEPVIPAIEEVNGAEDFGRIIEIGRNILRRQKKLDYEALFGELAVLKAQTSEGSTLQQLNCDLQVVQSAKDRVAEMAMDAMRHAMAYRRVADLLTEGWVRFSTAKAESSRKGEAKMKMVNFENAAMEAETLHKAILGVLKNLDSKHESLSRQITCFSLMLKLRDIARATPGMDYLPEHFGEDSGLPGPSQVSSSSVPNAPSTEPPTTGNTPTVTNPPGAMESQDKKAWETFMQAGH